MRLSFLEAPAEANGDADSWIDLRITARSLGQDAILLNEMPFGPWVLGRPAFDKGLAENSVKAHDTGLCTWLDSTNAAVLSSRPLSHRMRLVNEAFISQGEAYHSVHHKQHFPEEAGFYEQSWFIAGRPGFDPISIGGVNFGFLICTEIMFTEHARLYGSAGVHVIVVPRASGGDRRRWKTAAQMAAITSGCYVVSSNRVGRSVDGTLFNGCGFAVDPDGVVIAETCRADPIKSITIDIRKVERQRREYPCYLTSPQHIYSRRI